MKKLLTDDFPIRGTLREQELFLLRYAVRAPSTHNSQPWKFGVYDDRIELYLDKERRLVKADADGRDAVISLGACLEHLVIASKYFGMFDRCVSTPGSEHGPVATVYVRVGETPDMSFAPLMRSIAERFNARGPFISKKIPDDVEHEILALPLEDDIQLFVMDDNQKNSYASLTAEGMRKVHSDKEFRAELSRWVVQNYSLRKDGIPGYTMLVPGPFSLILPWMLRTFNLGSILALLNTKSILSSSRASLLISKEDSPTAWLATGRSFERISLLLATHGIRTSIYVASVEVPELREKLGALEGIRNGFPQFAFTFGYPKVELRQSPRFSPEERLIN